jgi:putative molybdopterin biosynthesis protein
LSICHVRITIDDMPQLETTLREKRRQAGLSQEVLAKAAHISRQAYAAIEHSEATPSTEVALRLALTLHTSVEGLFTLPPQETACIEAEWVKPAPALPDTLVRVRVDQVGDRLFATPLYGGGIQHILPSADGIAVSGASHDSVNVQLWPGNSQTATRLVAVGCDPATAVVASYLHNNQQVELVWREESSQQALEQLALGYAHIAGCHLFDEASDEYNTPWVERLLPFSATVVTFCVWEQGLMVARGNPKQIRGIEDLARPGVFMVNRGTGSGARALLDRTMTNAGLGPELVAGYAREASGHLVVADAVATGLADVGVGVKAAALAAGLDFIPLGSERYDLVVPDHFLNLGPVQQLLDSLRHAELRSRVEALGGYDTTNMGTAVAG